MRQMQQMQQQMARMIDPRMLQQMGMFATQDHDARSSK
jgi:hypothetical protein